MWRTAKTVCLSKTRLAYIQCLWKWSDFMFRQTLNPTIVWSFWMNWQKSRELIIEFKFDLSLVKIYFKRLETSQPISYWKSLFYLLTNKFETKSDRWLVAKIIGERSMRSWEWVWSPLQWALSSVMPSTNTWKTTERSKVRSLSNRKSRSFHILSSKWSDSQFSSKFISMFTKKKIKLK